MLRKLGYSINTIASTFGRSTSTIHRVLKRNLRNIDLRKLPARVRLLAAQRQRFNIRKYLKAWENFALGEGEKPP